jgi:capsular exopolysaccharide synthesis family protein
MSRLDEALRRSSTSSLKAALEQERQGKIFDSPWTVGEGSSSAVAAAHQPVPRKDASAIPANSRLVVTQPAGGFNSRWKEWLVYPEGDPAIVERFRRLAANLFHSRRDGRLKVIMVTSAVPGEGKTLTALNLALVLAESYRHSVLLVDADLRRPRLSGAAGLNVTRGLADALKAAEDGQVSLTQLTEHLTLLSAGRPDPEPLSGLTSSRMQRLLEEAAERFDWVIVDTPPVAVATDAGLLGAMVDGTMLVIRAGHTPHAAVRHAVDTLGRERIVGVVLNGVEQAEVSTYGDYATYDAPEVSS